MRGAKVTSRTDSFGQLGVRQLTRNLLKLKAGTTLVITSVSTFEFSKDAGMRFTNHNSDTLYDYTFSSSACTVSVSSRISGGGDVRAVSTALRSVIRNRKSNADFELIEEVESSDADVPALLILAAAFPSSELRDRIQNDNSHPFACVTIRQKYGKKNSSRVICAKDVLLTVSRLSIWLPTMSNREKFALFLHVWLISGCDTVPSRVGFGLMTNVTVMGKMLTELFVVRQQEDAEKTLLDMCFNQSSLDASSGSSSLPKPSSQHLQVTDPLVGEEATTFEEKKVEQAKAEAEAEAEAVAVAAAPTYPSVTVRRQEFAHVFTSFAYAREKMTGFGPINRFRTFVNPDNSLRAGGDTLNAVRVEQLRSSGQMSHDLCPSRAAAESVCDVVDATVQNWLWSLFRTPSTEPLDKAHPCIPSCIRSLVDSTAAAGEGGGRRLRRQGVQCRQTSSS